MKISREDVLHIARLARIALTEDEITKLSQQLSDLLENFEVLQQVDTEDVPPTAQSVELESIMRDDKSRPSYSPEEIMANAPLKDENCFRVKPVLE